MVEEVRGYVQGLRYMFLERGFHVQHVCCCECRPIKCQPENIRIYIYICIITRPAFVRALGCLQIPCSPRRRFFLQKRGLDFCLQMFGSLLFSFRTLQML